MPACDDDYYQQPQALPARRPLADPSGFARRVQRARLACAHLLKQAAELDHFNECTWYSEQAQARVQRLDAIVQAMEQV